MNDFKFWMTTSAIGGRAYSVMGEAYHRLKGWRSKRNFLRGWQISLENNTTESKRAYLEAAKQALERP